MTRMISIADVKTLLPLRAGNTSYDARLEQIITSVSSMIETECRQKFTKAERVEMHTARAAYTRTLNLYVEGEAYSGRVEEQIIPLRASPIDIAQPVTVWYDPRRKFTDDTLVADEYYTVDEELSRVLLTFPTDYARSAIRVRYTAGFAEGADGTLSDSLAEQAPDLKQAAILAALHMWNRSNPENVGSERDGDREDRTRNNAFGLPKECLALIAPYRRVLTGRI